MSAVLLDWDAASICCESDRQVVATTFKPDAIKDRERKRHQQRERDDKVFL